MQETQATQTGAPAASDTSSQAVKHPQPVRDWEDRLQNQLALAEDQLQQVAGDEATRACELTVVMPCLNEADTIGICVQKAIEIMQREGIDGEVVVADNGSTDGSQQIATQLGARVVPVSQRGYGNALMGGIESARGRYIIMGDADDSYDFLEIPKFLAQLRAGHELVQGCRLPTGGGTVMPGAMPFLHRWWGNPMFSWMVRTMFRAPINDVYCGLRGFTRDLYRELQLRCTGMEFATEMIIKSTLFGKDIVEVPTTLHPDGRKAHAPHLRTFRDGWRTLRFFLIYSPRWLFLAPGAVLTILGILGYALALPGVHIGGVSFDAHTLLCASLGLLLGHQMVSMALFARAFAASSGLMPEDPKTEVINRVVRSEKVMIAGSLALAVGIGMLAFAANTWRLQGFGDLNYPQTLRWVIPGVTLAALGFQTIASSFFLAVLNLARR